MGGIRRSSSDSSSPERVDQFGRIIKKERRTSADRNRRSRSRDRIRRSRSRDRFRRSHSRERFRRSRSRNRSRSRDRIRLSPRRDRIRSPSRTSHRSPSHISISSRSSRRRTRSRSRERRSLRGSRDRSRDRLRDRSRDRLRDRSRDRSVRSLSHRRSHSRGRSPRRRSPTPHPENVTSVDDPELLKARIFIGNLPVSKITKEDLEAQFSKYGKLIGVSIHDRGFGFVQFEKESEALEAVRNEDGGLLKGSKLDVKMALEGRRGFQGKGPRRPSPQNSAYEGSDSGYPPREGRPPPSTAPPARGAPPARERSPLRADPYEDRYRDPYRDPLPPPPPGRRDDPYYAADAYRRPLPPDDPYYDRYRDDPYRYRRDPYGPDPYRDPYRDIPPYDAAPPPRKPLPIDCHIILTSATLRNYGDFIERKIKAINLFVNSSVIPDDKTIPQMIEEASKRGVLFAIVLNSQNEAHQSLTLNILHGTPQVVNNDGHGPLVVRKSPQEHRNMPLEDAVTLIGRSFEQQQKTLREKEAAAPPSVPAAPIGRRTPPPFLPPGPDITYLLNLLADNRQLTIEEIDKVIGYLRKRRDKMLEAEGRLPEEGQYIGSGDRKEDAASLQKQQQELQAKILSILNGPGEGSAAGVSKGVPPTGNPGMGGGMGNGQARDPGMSSLINFDNPSVQKALDNLISSGPNLLKNISSAAPGTTQTQAHMSRDGGIGEMRRDPHMMAREGGYGGISSPPRPGLQTAHMQAAQRAMFSGIQGQPPRGPMPGVRPQRF